MSKLWIPNLTTMPMVNPSFKWDEREMQVVNFGNSFQFLVAMSGSQINT
jgi:hypothetical protein